MSVTGEVHPDRILTNAGLRPGQDLILTKPLGVGVITTAIKADVAPGDVAEAAIASMTRINDVASRVALEAGATAARMSPVSACSATSVGWPSSPESR